MKYRLLVFVFLLPLLALAQLPSYVPTTGLAAWYGMNNSPNDLSGNGNNAVLNGGVTAIVDRNGNANSAYAFNGTNGNLVVQTPGFQFSPTGQFTYSVWIRRATTAGVPLIMATTAANNFISMIGGGTDMRFGTNKQQSAWIWATTTHTLNLWAHYVAVYDNGSMNFYKDGVLAASATYTHANAQTATLPLYIGSGIATSFFNGSLDDFGVWTRALSPTEIEALYQGCIAGIAQQPRDTTIRRAAPLRLIASASGSGVSYQWQSNAGSGFTNLNNGGLFAGATSDTLLISAVDFSLNNVAFRCIASASACADTSNVATITVLCNQQLSNQPLNTTKNMNETALFITSSLDAATQYQWQVDSSGSFVNLSNGGQFSGVNDDSLRISNLRFAQSGQRFRCILTNTPCSDTSSAANLTVINTTSVANYPWTDLRIYPNPAADHWNIVSDKLNTATSFRLLDVLGKEQRKGPVPHSAWHIDAADLPAGLYFLEIDGRLLQQKLIRP